MVSSSISTWSRGHIVHGAPRHIAPWFFGKTTGFHGFLLFWVFSGFSHGTCMVPGYPAHGFFRKCARHTCFGFFGTAHGFPVPAGYTPQCGFSRKTRRFSCGGTCAPGFGFFPFSPMRSTVQTKPVCSCCFHDAVLPMMCHHGLHSITSSAVSISAKVMLT